MIFAEQEGKSLRVFVGLCAGLYAVVLAQGVLGSGGCVVGVRSVYASLGCRIVGVCWGGLLVDWDGLGCGDWAWS